MSDEMTIGELMGLLEDEPEDALVRIVHQESWPLQEVLGGIAPRRDIHDEDDDDDGNPDGTSIVYLVANGHPTHDSPYGPRGAWDVMRRC